MFNLGKKLVLAAIALTGVDAKKEVDLSPVPAIRKANLSDFNEIRA